MEQLVGVAEQEIGLRHPLVYDDFNFSDLSAKGRLAKVLENQKLGQLQSLCEYFEYFSILSTFLLRVLFRQVTIFAAQFCNRCRLVMLLSGSSPQAVSA